jgi:hypothetical protein
MINIKNSDKSSNNTNQKETPIVFDYRKFNFSKLEYIEPKKKANVVSSSIYYRASINKVINLFIRTPLMCTVSGICKKNNNYYIDLELDITNKHCDFYDFMNKFDNNNKQVVFQNSIEWFNEQLPLDVIDDYYIPSVTLVSGGKLPIIRVKIKSKGDIIIPKIFNNYGAEVDLSYVSPKDEIEAVIILDELKFFKEKFTPEWSLGQLKVFKKKFKSIVIPEQYLLADENDLHDQEYEQINENEIQNDSEEEDDIQIKQFLEKKNLLAKKTQEQLEERDLKLLEPNFTKEILDKERLEQERLEKERLEQERLEQERLEQERLEQERLEQERLEQERLEKERLEQERLGQERLEKERLEQERLEKIRLEKIKKLELLRQHEEKIKLEHEKLLKEMKEIEENEFVDHNNINIEVNNFSGENNNDNNDNNDNNENNENNDNYDDNNDYDYDYNYQEYYNNNDIQENNTEENNNIVENDNYDSNNYEDSNKYYKVDPEWDSVLKFDDNIEEVSFD